MDGLPIDNPRNIDDFNIGAVETEKWRPDHRMVRPGKTEDAMGALGMIGITGGRLRSALTVMDTKLETWRVVAGMREEGEARKDDQQALRGDSVRHDDADHRPPKPLGSTTESDHLYISSESACACRIECQRSKSKPNAISQSVWPLRNIRQKSNAQK